MPLTKNTTTEAAYKAAIAAIEQEDDKTLNSILLRPDAKEILTIGCTSSSSSSSSSKKSDMQQQRTLLNAVVSNVPWTLDNKNDTLLKIVINAIKRVGGKPFLKQQLEVTEPNTPEQTPLIRLCENPRFNFAVSLPLFFDAMIFAGGAEFLKSEITGRSSCGLLYLVEASFLKQSGAGIKIFLEALRKYGGLQETKNVLTMYTNYGDTVFQCAVADKGSIPVIEAFLTAFKQFDGSDWGPIMQEQMKVNINDDDDAPILHLVCSNRYFSYTAPKIIKALSPKHDKKNTILAAEVKKTWNGKSLLWCVLNRPQEEDEYIVQDFAEIISGLGQLTHQLQSLDKDDQKTFHLLTNNKYKIVKKVKQTTTGKKPKPKKVWIAYKPGTRTRQEAIAAYSKACYAAWAAAEKKKTAKKAAAPKKATKKVAAAKKKKPVVVKKKTTAKNPAAKKAVAPKKKKKQAATKKKPAAKKTAKKAAAPKTATKKKPMAKKTKK